MLPAHTKAKMQGHNLYDWGLRFASKNKKLTKSEYCFVLLCLIRLGLLLGLGLLNFPCQCKSKYRDLLTEGSSSGEKNGHTFRCIGRMDRKSLMVNFFNNVWQQLDAKSECEVTWTIFSWAMDDDFALESNTHKHRRRGI